MPAGEEEAADVRRRSSEAIVEGEEVAAVVVEHERGFLGGRRPAEPSVRGDYDVLSLMRRPRGERSVRVIGGQIDSSWDIDRGNASRRHDDVSSGRGVDETEES